MKAGGLAEPPGENQNNAPEQTDHPGRDGRRLKTVAAILVCPITATGHAGRRLFTRSECRRRKPGPIPTARREAIRQPGNSQTAITS